MKVEIRDLCKPVYEYLPKYFALLPSITIVDDNGKKYLYIGWLNYMIVFSINTDHKI